MIYSLVRISVNTVILHNFCIVVQLGFQNMIKMHQIAPFTGENLK